MEHRISKETIDSIFAIKDRTIRDIKLSGVVGFDTQAIVIESGYERTERNEFIGFHNTTTQDLFLKELGIEGSKVVSIEKDEETNEYLINIKIN